MDSIMDEKEYAIWLGNTAPRDNILAMFLLFLFKIISVYIE
tara:strand:+ start:789 stop:911 length:123 start_codon:yes stop_codon:yes gene_type:complete